MVLPKATISEIIGLLEAVNDAGGVEDAARLAADFDLELDEILPSIDGAELLGFVIVSDGNIELTGEAKRLLDAGIQERKKIIRDKVARVPIIKELTEKLLESGECRMSKEDVLKFIQKRIAAADVEDYFKIIINWTRHAGLIGYDSDSEEIYLMCRV
ncbi:MAG: AAA-associated domain-containing protein [Candidatus Methanoperedens sp.]|nr:AAA-associated domain-containing protein [Candidatus Methanoperedens sp.]